MRTLPAYLFLCLGLPLNAQYISEVLSYTPAPGQFINQAPWGIPSAAGTIAGGLEGTLSLGVFGGEVVFRFDGPVENDPDNPFGVDFILFGNALPGWSEPGVVWVMKDENENGKPDDTWYELAGSDHFFSGTQRNSRVTYRNPGGTGAADVPWEDNRGNEGLVRVAGTHTQPYYPLSDSFPHIPAAEYELRGTRITGMVLVNQPPPVHSLRRAFGYADNTVRGSPPYTTPDNPYTRDVENAGGDSFDIAWAVDSAGNYVELESIDFIRVQSGVLYQGGWLGEISTEISGGVDVPPQPGITGNRRMIVIHELPPEIGGEDRSLEAVSLEGGKPRKDAPITWIPDQPWAHVDEQHVLTLEGTGPLTLTAQLASDPGVSASVSTTVVGEATFSLPGPTARSRPVVYPNPAGERIRVHGSAGDPLTLFHPAGQVIRTIQADEAQMGFDISGLAPGLYVIRVGEGPGACRIKFIKQ